MSLPLILAALWALAAALVAMLPMRRQYAPGFVLLVAAPLLIGWIGAVHGWVPAALGVAAFGSMFRHPLVFLARRAVGLPASRPEQRESARDGDRQ